MGRPVGEIRAGTVIPMSTQTPPPSWQSAPPGAPPAAAQPSLPAGYPAYAGYAMSVPAPQGIPGAQLPWGQSPAVQPPQGPPGWQAPPSPWGGVPAVGQAASPYPQQNVAQYGPEYGPAEPGPAYTAPYSAIQPDDTPLAPPRRLAPPPPQRLAEMKTAPGQKPRRNRGIGPGMSGMVNAKNGPLVAVLGVFVALAGGVGLMSLLSGSGEVGPSRTGDVRPVRDDATPPPTGTGSSPTMGTDPYTAPAGGDPKGKSGKTAPPPVRSAFPDDPDHGGESGAPPASDDRRTGTPVPPGRGNPGDPASTGRGNSGDPASTGRGTGGSPDSSGRGDAPDSATGGATAPTTQPSTGPGGRPEPKPFVVPTGVGPSGVTTVDDLLRGVQVPGTDPAVSPVNPPSPGTTPPLLPLP